MSKKFEIIEIKDSKLWDDFIENSRQRTIFCTSLFSEILRKTTGRGYKIYGVLKNGNLVAGCPVYEKIKYGFKMAILPPLVPHLGIVLKDDKSLYLSKREYLTLKVEELLSERFSREYSYINLTNHPNLQDIRGFDWAGWKINARYTYIVNFKEKPKISPSAKRQINKALKAGIKVKESSNIEEFANIVYKSYLRHGNPPPYSEEYLINIANYLFSKKIGILLVAKDSEKRILSGMIMIKDKKTLYEWVVAGDPEFHETGANSLLLSYIFSNFSSQFDKFDFMGANTQTIAKFKTNFGGQLVPYYTCEKYTPLFSVMLRGYRFIKRRGITSR